MHRTVVFILSVLAGLMLSSEAAAQDCANCPKMKSEKSSSLSSAKSRTYAGQQTRALKALDQNQIEGYLNGEGMGMAMAAELNHYPGPRHLLAFAKELALTPELQARIQQTFDRMHEETTTLGAEIVGKERLLDSLFANALITPEALAQSITEIAGLQGKLRLAHLQAHLSTRSQLTPAQIAKYDELRGYSGQSPKKMNHKKMHQMKM